MNKPNNGMWDYLIVTASHDTQARAYQSHLQLRQELGLLPQVRQFLVVADWEGKRVGSGGSTLCCLAEVLNRETGRSGSVEERLRGLRILIVHAGGDSRRLPAYGPCGKIFVPVPSGDAGCLPKTLFDLLVPDLLNLPEGAAGGGQVLVAAGDALIRFDASALRLDLPGITMLGCLAEPEEASRHGVYCLGPDGKLVLYLQKPKPAEQQAAGAMDASGKSPLDLGLTSLDAAAAARLLGAFGSLSPEDGRFQFTGAARTQILRHGVDLYREICCAMGSSATVGHYMHSARSSGSTWSDQQFAAMFPILQSIPAQVQLLPDCSFLHFGATRQLIESGLALTGQAAGGIILAVNNGVAAGGTMAGGDAWVEGCRITAPLDLAGQNVVVGVDVEAALALAVNACLDIVCGHARQGEKVWFVRCYGIADSFKDSRLGGRPMQEWLAEVGVSADEIWPHEADTAKRSLWNGRVFPAVQAAAEYRNWLWMYAPETATSAQKEAFRAADRYSVAEIALLADQAEFHLRRTGIWVEEAGRAGVVDAPTLERVQEIAALSFRG